MNSKVKGMRACQVCGRDFPLIAEEAYVARDVESSGIPAAIVGEVESAWYDAIDCPHCGGQNVLQERKRPLTPEDTGEEECGGSGCCLDCGEDCPAREGGESGE